MPKYRHPRTLESVRGNVPPATVAINGENVPVEDGTFTTTDTAGVRAVARSYDVALSTLRVDDDADSDDVSGTCEVVKGDGEVCGRDRPCPYHD